MRSLLLISLLFSLSFSSTLSLQSGWNLMGNPTQESLSHPSDDSMGNFWSYSDGTWSTTSDVSSCQGFWVKSTESTTLSLPESNSCQPDLFAFSEGWQLLGTGETIEMLSTDPYIDLTWTYQEEQWNKNPETVHEGWGVWAKMRSTKQCDSDIILPSPTPQYAVGNSHLAFQSHTKIEDHETDIIAKLEEGHDAFTFEVVVPNDSSLYGAYAGQTLDYLGLITYPTTDSNPYADGIITIDDAQSLHGVENDVTLSHMQLPGSAPIFADESAKYPLIVHSHGLGGWGTYWHEEMEKFSEQGFVTLSIWHEDMQFDMFSNEQFMMRPLAITGAIDAILSSEAFGSHIDPDKIGGFGYSYGGPTLLSAMGGKPFSTTLFRNVETAQDLRIRAFMGVEPYIGAELALMPTDTYESIIAIFSGMGLEYQYLFGLYNNAGLSSINQPVLILAGTEDYVYPVIDESLSYLQGEKYWVKLEGGDHSPDDGALEDMVAWGTYFFGTHLQKDLASRRQLYCATSAAEGAEDALVESSQ